MKVKVTFFLAGILFGISLFYNIPALYANESIFNKGENCVAYKAKKEMFFVSNVEVIGKSCQIHSKMKWLKNKEQVQFVVSIPIKSLDSDSSKRDGSVLEILKAIKYPNITFTSEWINLKKLKAVLPKGKLKVEGKIAFMGKSFSVKFPLQFSSEIGTVRVRGQWIGTFSAFGLKAPSVGPGGMIAKTANYLELHVYLKMNKITGTQELFKKLNE